MRTVHAILLAFAVAGLAAAPAALADRSPAPHEVATFSDYGYTTPDDWSCKMDDTCLVCRNTSSHLSDVIVTHTPSEERDIHSVPREGTVRSCGNVIFLPHGAEE